MMGLSGAERQARWRARRHAELKQLRAVQQGGFNPVADAVPMEDATPVTDASELPFSKAQVVLAEAAHNLPNGRPRNCCRNAFRRIKQAWRLRLLDPEMAVFSAMTGVEEAASA